MTFRNYSSTRTANYFLGTLENFSYFGYLFIVWQFFVSVDVNACVKIIKIECPEVIKGQVNLNVL